MELVSLCDIIVEAVSPKVAKDVLELSVKNSKDVLIMSVGGMVECASHLEEARSRGIKVFFPSGAIAGLDAIKAAKEAGIESVSITTKKPPRSLQGTVYLEEKGIDINAITGETVIFEGNAAEAIKVFPKNINVSVVLSMAAMGPEKQKFVLFHLPSSRKIAMK